MKQTERLNNQCMTQKNDQDLYQALVNLLKALTKKYKLKWSKEDLN